MTDPSEALAALEEELAMAVAAAMGCSGDASDVRCEMLGELIIRECTNHSSLEVSNWRSD